MRLPLRMLCTIGTLMGIGTSLEAPARADGAGTYATRCAMCHQSDGAGLPGQFPRLSGRVSKIAASKEGRALLGRILLFGMYGSVSVDGKTASGLMPPMASLGDQDLADVLNHVVAMKKTGKPAPFTAAEIAALRVTKLSGAAVASERNALAAQGVVP